MPTIRRANKPYGWDIGLYEGEARLGGLLLFDLQMRIGGQAVRMGGIGGVGVEREHRGHGYARLVIEDALALMRAEGFAMSVLFGIPGFYPKWGFVSAMAESTLTIDTVDALQSPAALPVRAMRPEDAPAIARLYARANATRSGSIVRPEATFTGFRHGFDWNDNVAVVVVEDAGQLAGYAVYNSEPWAGQVAELEAETVAARATLVRWFAERTHERAREKVVFTVPYDHALVDLATGLGCKLQIGYLRWGNCMARIINQAALLQTLTPLLAERLQASALAWRGSLVIETQLGTDHLALGCGGEQAVRLSQERLTQLLLGYRAVSDLYAEGELDCAPDTVPLLAALFPRGYPYMWHPDRF